MKFVLLIFMALHISCKNQGKENEMTTSEQQDTLKTEIQDTKIEATNIDTIKIVAQLQGKWKEIEYPYRSAEFVSSTVKFIEEGTAGTQKYEKYMISEDCPFENNNIRDLKPGYAILTIPASNRCEQLKVSTDTLTLSGYSTNSNGDYNIIYLRLK